MRERVRNRKREISGYIGEEKRQSLQLAARVWIRKLGQRVLRDADVQLHVFLLVRLPPLAHFRRLALYARRVHKKSSIQNHKFIARQTHLIHLKLIKYVFVKKLGECGN